MHTIEFPHNNKRLYMPSHLGECDNNQFAHMCYLMFQYQNKEITLQQFKYNAVYQLLNLEPINKSKLNKIEAEKKEANILLLSEELESFFSTNEDNQIYIKQEFTKNPMPYIPLLKGKLKGPKDNFEDMTFGQYLDALDIFGNFVKEPETELIYDLCATLYQKGVYNKDDVPKIKKTLKNNFFGYVYGAYIIFTTFQHTINNSLIMVEGNLCDLSILYKKSEGQKKYTNLPNLGMKSVAFTLAESGVFGDYNEVRNSPLWEILARLYDMRVRDLEEEARQKEQEKKIKSKKR